MASQRLPPASEAVTLCLFGCTCVGALSSSREPASAWLVSKQPSLPTRALEPPAAWWRRVLASMPVRNCDLSADAALAVSVTLLGNHRLSAHFPLELVAAQVLFHSSHTWTLGESQRHSFCKIFLWLTACRVSASGVKCQAKAANLSVRFDA